MRRLSLSFGAIQKVEEEEKGVQHVADVSSVPTTTTAAAAAAAGDEQKNTSAAAAAAAVQQEEERGPLGPLDAFTRKWNFVAASQGAGSAPRYADDDEQNTALTALHQDSFIVWGLFRHYSSLGDPLATYLAAETLRAADHHAPRPRCELQRRVGEPPAPLVTWYKRRRDYYASLLSAARPLELLRPVPPAAGHRTPIAWSV